GEEHSESHHIGNPALPFARIDRLRQQLHQASVNESVVNDFSNPVILCSLLCPVAGIHGSCQPHYGTEELEDDEYEQDRVTAQPSAKNRGNHQQLEHYSEERSYPLKWLHTSITRLLIGLASPLM